MSTSLSSSSLGSNLTTGQVRPNCCKDCAAVLSSALLSDAPAFEQLCLVLGTIRDQLLKASVLEYLVLFASLLLGKAAAHFEKISFQILAHLGCQLMVWRRFGFGRLRWRLFRLLLGGHGISGSSGAIFQKELSFGALRNTIGVIVLELPRAETEVLSIYFCLDAHPLHALNDFFSTSLALCPAGGREFEAISDASALLGRHRRVGALPTARGAHGCY